VRAEDKSVVIRASPRLVQLAAIAALCAVATVPLPALVAPMLAFAAIVIALGLADLYTSRRDPAPKLERVLPERMVKGRPATLLYVLSRPDGGVTSLRVLDELPADLGGDLLIDEMRLSRNETREVSREIVPLRRGIHDLGPTFILWRSRLGLLRLRATKASAGTIAVLSPASAPERRVGLSHKSLRDELGMRPRPARGEGAEFESLREYVSGDDPRHLDWRATARRGRLIVRQHQTERRHTVMLTVDTGRLMGTRVDDVSKLDRAIDCAVALARACNEYGDRVGFMAFDRELRVLVRPRSGATGAGAMVRATLALEPSTVEPNYRVLVEALARYQRRRALVVVLTDFVEGSASRGLEACLAVLARRHMVMLVALRDRLLAELDEPRPDITRDALYRRLALQDIAAEREAGLARIARFGAQTLDLDPARVTAPVLNRYLAIRRAGLV
jgi:uncharacterized protein (DUF58 family)